MNRRGFLGSLLGLVLAPIAAKFPAVLPPLVEASGWRTWEGPILEWQIGRYESVRFIESTKLPGT